MKKGDGRSEERGGGHGRWVMRWVEGGEEEERDKKREREREREENDKTKRQERNKK